MCIIMNVHYWKFRIMSQHVAVNEIKTDGASHRFSGPEGRKSPWVSREYCTRWKDPSLRQKLGASNGCGCSFPGSNFILILPPDLNSIPILIWNYYFILILKVNVNFIPILTRSYFILARKLNFIHLSLPKINFILLSGKSIATQQVKGAEKTWPISCGQLWAWSMTSWAPTGCNILC